MADPGDLGTNTGLIGSVSAGVALAIGWGISLVLKRLGLTSASAAEANNQAQKDMLDWQKEQLKDEVARREKAETLVQDLLLKQNEFTLQMSRLEQQNQKLQDQVQFLTATVEQLKANLNGAPPHAP
ncbi:hypothetical protein [Pseudomonas mediterranea]|uniref:hypothetical protein n=1 Tax=Pseudomonas mediterranea TaxID=183795 RepID=UPI00128EADF6|nr:hypothetical protein [Pseudomonas mediterranea]